MAPTVLFLDDDQDLRETLSELFGKVLGLETLALASYDELVRNEPQALATSVALLDLNLGPNVPSGAVAFQWLREKGYRGAVTFLTGHGRHHPLVAQAIAAGAARVAEKPLNMSELEALVTGALPVSQA